MTVRSLKPVALTKENFAPFGIVIEVEGARSYPINEGTTTRFHKLAVADTSSDNGEPIISVFRGTPRINPVELRMMERHPISSQAFYPVTPDDWLVVVVVAVDRPGPVNLHAFSATGNQGVQYARNVWHHPLLVRIPEQDFLIVDRSGPGENLEEHWFPEGEFATLSV